MNNDGEDEIGGMPPLPRPRARPHARTPLAAPSTAEKPVAMRSVLRGTASQPGVGEPPHLTAPQPSPVPVPHAHPLHGWKPRNASPATATGRDTGRGTATSLEVRSRHVPSERLDRDFLNHDRIAAFASLTALNHDDDNDQFPEGDHEERTIVTRSTAALAMRMQRVQQEDAAVSELGEEERRHAATDASEFRKQLEYADPYNDALHELQENEDNDEDVVMQQMPDSALARARTRKVKKQVDARWLRTREDPTLRPLAPLARPEERHYYESTYQLSLGDVLRDGIIWNEEDDARVQMLTQPLGEVEPLPVETRATTAQYGCCFDQWAF